MVKDINFGALGLRALKHVLDELGLTRTVGLAGYHTLRSFSELDSCLLKIEI